jgi:hypothetical protein
MIRHRKQVKRAHKRQSVDFPAELLLHIFSYLPKRTLLGFKRVRKSWQELIIRVIPPKTYEFKLSIYDRDADCEEEYKHYGKKILVQAYSKNHLAHDFLFHVVRYWDWFQLDGDSCFVEDFQVHLVKLIKEFKSNMSDKWFAEETKSMLKRNRNVKGVKKTIQRKYVVALAYVIRELRSGFAAEASVQNIAKRKIYVATGLPGSEMYGKEEESQEGSDEDNSD